MPPSTSSRIALLREQLVREGLIKEGGAHKPRQTHSHREDKALRVEDLQESSGVSSTSDITADSSTLLSDFGTSPPPLQKPFEEGTSIQLLNPVSSVEVTSTLGQINDRLEEVLEKLDKQRGPPIGNRRWAEHVALPLSYSWDRFAASPSPVPPPSSDLDVKLCQRWNEYLSKSRFFP